LKELFQGFQPAFVAGHSMGELSASLGAGSLNFQNALALARTRGRLMKEAGDSFPGGMAAIIGLDIRTLETICSKASSPNEVVQVANDNCPGQVVISGAGAALDRAIIAAQAAGARRAVKLAVSIAAHSPLMQTAQNEFNQAVEHADIQDPQIPLIGNVSGQPIRFALELKTDLMGQLTNRVRWTESIQYLTQAGVDTFIEIGSGSVLSGLVKRISKEATCITLGAPQDFDRLLAL
jgi:[acyl-carrier-protein] S-malonyltransferase